MSFFSALIATNDEYYGGIWARFSAALYCYGALL